MNHWLTTILRSTATAAALLAAQLHAEDFSKAKHGDFIKRSTPQGILTAAPDHASIYKKSADTKSGSLRINGGPKRQVLYTLSPELQKQDLLGLSFQGERWTRGTPFEFSVQAKSQGKWQQVYNGSKLGVGGFSAPINVALKKQPYEAFRFQATTKAGSGVLIDNLQVLPNKDMKIGEISVTAAQVPILIRKKDAPILNFTINASGAKKPDSLTQLSFSTAGTTALTDISNFTLYADNDRLATIQPAKELSVALQAPLKNGVNQFSLRCNLKPTASLTRRVHASLTAVTFANAGKRAINETTPASPRRIGFNVAHSGDEVVRTDGSKMICKRMRIPGMATSNKGTLLAVYDLRWRQNGDLPGDIDVGLSRSIDGGITWEAPRPIMDMGEYLGQDQSKNGVGDPAILVDRKNGDIYVVALLAHGLNRGWYWGLSKPGMDPALTGQCIIVKSSDDGKTWSPPKNVTSTIKDPAWQLMLDGPGKGITMRDGTLVFAFQYKENVGTKDKPKYSARSSILYSRDKGESWKVAPGIDYPQETTEAQLIELNNGNLMLNCRISRGGRAVFTTSDLGKTWHQHHTSGTGTFNMTGCMSSIIRYASVKDGDSRNVLLFSGPADGGKKRRSHMSIRYSLDEGESWSEPYLLDQLGGAYSCMSLIDPSGRRDIGIIYEGSQSNMTFERLTIDELIP